LKFLIVEKKDGRWENMRRGHWESYDLIDGLPSVDVPAILEDREGSLWFGTSGGVSCYDGQSFVNFTTEDGLADNNVWSILEDREGYLWFGTRGGVSCYDGQSLVNFTTKDGLAHDRVWSIVEDREGNLWFGTEGGVSRYDGESFQTMTVKDGLSCNYIRCILQDREGNFWFGTNGGGVCKYDGRNFQEITTRDGLAHDTVRKMIQDKAGNFWFATPNRVTRYAPSAQVVKPRIRITEVIADKAYELPLNKGNQGVVPDSIETSASQVIFEYKGLSFKTKFDRIKYIYRLDGRDTDWGQATRERRARYEELEPGEYVFQVKAIDRDLNYSDAAEVRLKVIPDPRNHRIIQLEEHIHQQELAELERMHQELEDARQIQQSLLPDKPPEIEAFEVAGTSLPAREVSGDFYSYLSLGDNTGIVLADVTGKSVKAAMVAAMTNGMLHSEVEGHEDIWDSPAGILSRLDVRLQPRLIPGMFAAMSLGILHAEEKRLVFSNAGMPYPIVKRASKVRELEVNGTPLGLVVGAEYQDLNVDMEEGDLVIFYSDGVTEAANEADEIYQTERLLELIQQADPGISAQEMVELILRDVTAFLHSEEASDDITIVVLRCRD
jgi:serine phosphatase RsbU (regulator of sigma subunit)